MSKTNTNTEAKEQSKREAKREAKNSELNMLKNTVASDWGVRETITAAPKLEFFREDGGALITLDFAVAVPVSGAQLATLRGMTKEQRAKAAAKTIADAFSVFSTETGEPILSESNCLYGSAKLEPLMGSYGDSERNDYLRAQTFDPMNMGAAFFENALEAADTTEELACWTTYQKSKRTRGAYLDYLDSVQALHVSPRADVERGYYPYDFGF